MTLLVKQAIPFVDQSNAIYFSGCSLLLHFKFHNNEAAENEQKYSFDLVDTQKVPLYSAKLLISSSTLKAAISWNFEEYIVRLLSDAEALVYNYIPKIARRPKKSASEEEHRCRLDWLRVSSKSEGFGDFNLAHFNPKYFTQCQTTQTSNFKIGRAHV